MNSKVELFDYTDILLVQNQSSSSSIANYRPTPKGSEADNGHRPSTRHKGLKKLSGTSFYNLLISKSQ